MADTDLDFDWSAVEGFDPDFFGLYGETINGLPAIDWSARIAGDTTALTPEVAASPATWDAVHRFESGAFNPATAAPSELMEVAAALGLDVPGLTDPQLSPSVSADETLRNMDVAEGGRASVVPGETGAWGPSEETLRNLQTAFAEVPELKQVLFNTSTAQFVDASGRPVTADSNPTLWTRVKEGVDKVNDVLKTPLGGIGGILALGATGLLLGQAFTGGGQKFRAPGPPPLTPAQQAGQNALTAALGPRPAGAPGAPTAPGATTGRGATSAVPMTTVPGSVAGGLPFVDPAWFTGRGASGAEDLAATVSGGLAGQRNVADALAAASGRELFTQAEQYPMERLVRQLALGQIPAQMDRTLASRIMSDPLLAMIYGQALTAAGEGRANPMLERKFEDEERALRNQLYRDNGPGYENSTTGIQALAEMRQRQNALRAEDNRQTVSAYSPLALAREQFGEGVRSSGLNENVALSQGFGRQPLPQLTSQLNTVVPTMPLLGIDNAAADRRLQQNLDTQLALEAFRSRSASDQALANSIAGIFGSAAGSFGSNRRLRVNPDGSFTIG